MVEFKDIVQRFEKLKKKIKKMKWNVIRLS